MRKPTLIFAMLCVVSAMSLFAASAQTANNKLLHPGDTALIENEAGQFEYKSFPTMLRLYVYDKDAPGKSNCYEGCATAWPPLVVSASEKSAVGDWTITQREDGVRQWVYKGMPVYTRFHDMEPDASIAQEGFRLLKP